MHIETIKTSQTENDNVFLPSFIEFEERTKINSWKQYKVQLYRCANMEAASFINQNIVFDGSSFIQVDEELFNLL